MIAFLKKIIQYPIDFLTWVRDHVGHILAVIVGIGILYLVFSLGSWWSGSKTTAVEVPAPKPAPTEARVAPKENRTINERVLALEEKVKQLESTQKTAAPTPTPVTTPEPKEPDEPDRIKQLKADTRKALEELGVK